MMVRWLGGAYLAVDFGTMAFLTFFDGYRYTSWNWIVAIPANFILSTIWPIYWAVLRPFFS